MKERLTFDNENIVEIIDAIIILVDRFNRCHVKRGFNRTWKNSPHVITDIVRIDTHSKVYKIYFPDREMVLEPRIAKRKLMNRGVMNLVRINKFCVVNLGFVNFIDKFGCVHMKRSREILRLTQRYRRRL
ncbi:MAG: hypothetical protein IKS48_12375 [Eubacterium sp.]|nr:hypothetical protein [Eubacterium sp.]